MASPKLSPSCFKDTCHRTRHAGRHGQEMVGGNLIVIMSSRHGPSLLQPLNVPVLSVITPVHSHSPPSGSQLHEVLEHVHLHHLTTSTFFTLLPEIPRLLESDPSYLPRLLRLAARACGMGRHAGRLGQLGDAGKPLQVHGAPRCQQGAVPNCSVQRIDFPSLFPGRTLWMHLKPSRLLQL